MSDKTGNYVTIVGSGAKHLNITSDIDMILGSFNNKECQVQLLTSVRHKHVIIIQSFNDTNDNLIELLILIDAVKRSMAASVTVIAPIFPYARQDRRSDSGTPISARVVCDLLNTTNIDRLITVDLHATQIQGFMDNSIGFDHISSSAFLAYHLRNKFRILTNTSICSPDAGGVKRAKKMQKLLGAPSFSLMTKTRVRAGEVESIEVTGDVFGKEVIIVDDMIDTARTLAAGIEALYEAGAVGVSAVATHGLFSGPAFERLEGVDVYTTNTLRIDNAPSNIHVFDITPLINRVIDKVCNGEHFSDLFHTWTE